GAVPERQPRDVTRAERKVVVACLQLVEGLALEVQTDHAHAEGRVIGDVLAAAAAALQHQQAGPGVLPEERPQGIELTEAEGLLERAVAPRFVPEIRRAPALRPR